MLEMIEPLADYLLAGCHLVICFVIIPLIWEGRKVQHVPYLTSLGFIILLSILALALLSQGLVFGAVTDFMGAALWGIVAGERACQGRRSTSSH